MTMSDETKPVPTDRQVLEEIHSSLSSHLKRMEPLIQLAEGWAKAKASFGKWGKK